MANDPGPDPWNRNASFNSGARHKRSMTCDIMTPEGHEALLRLLAHCDVLVENNVPETMDKANIRWEELHTLNPRLIMLRMPAFALDGPYRNYRAFGLHVEALIGHTHLRGYPGREPGNTERIAGQRWHRRCARGSRGDDGAATPRTHRGRTADRDAADGRLLCQHSANSSWSIR